MTTARAAPPDVFLWVDGRRADPESAAHLSALDRGFTLGDGLFETMRAYHGTLFRLDRHLERLAHGARVLGIPLPPNLRPLISNAMRDAREAGLRDAAVRLTISRGVGPRGLAPPPNVEPTVVLTIHALSATPPAPGRRALVVHTARGRHNEHALTAGLKTLAYAES
ncbi:MAG: aminotransferase class IV, partial [Steroidobacteraceae bacterium]